MVDYSSSNAGSQLSRSLHQTGFCVLVNHPIPRTLIEDVYEEWSIFFDSEAKFKYLFSPDTQEGYFPRAQAGAAPVNRDDKEFFHLFSWGRIPDEVSAAAIKYRELAMGLASELLEMIEVHTPAEVRQDLPMPLSEMLVGGEKNTLLRILRYPPVSDARPGPLRAGEHKDTNLLTLLAAGSAPGLEVLRYGAWQEVPWDMGSLTINAGSMLEMVTRDYYPSAVHRVVKSADESALRARLAMPLFLHPGDDVVLDGLQTAKAYLAERKRANLAQKLA